MTPKEYFNKKIKEFEELLKTNPNHKEITYFILEIPSNYSSIKLKCMFILGEYKGMNNDEIRDILIN